ncbi:MAG: FecR domain-containing protein [Campylobacterales bacterium]|nr:FecR domain-containing protein [Campylobacterales bacterium]
MKNLVVMFLLLCVSVFGANNEAGIIKSVSGDAFLIKDGKTKSAVKVGDKFFEKDTIVTTRGAKVGLIFNDNTLVSVGSNSEFIVREYVFKPGEQKSSFIGRLNKGTLACATGLIAKMNPDSMKMESKTATIGIRGTYFVVEAD